MKSFLVLSVLLASALNTLALATPGYRVRRQNPGSSGNGTGTDQDSICAGSVPTLLSTSMIPVTGTNAMLELSQFSCAVMATSPSAFRAAHESPEQILEQWLKGLLWWLFPPANNAPPRTTTRTTTRISTTTRSTTLTTTATRSVTATTTATAVRTTTASATTTATVTAISVSATTATETEIETATVSETETATEIQTATETETAILTQTETATATLATTETDSETVTQVVTSTITAPGSTPTNTGTDVCGEICTTVCGELGQLPPITEDCQQLVNSITILNGQIPPEFTVQSNHVQTISFGTCRFFFENISPGPLTFCWTSLVQQASAAASACLPPNQPVLSEGLCIARSGLWEVGAAHS